MLQRKRISKLTNYKHNQQCLSFEMFAQFFLQTAAFYGLFFLNLLPVFIESLLFIDHEK